GRTIEAALQKEYGEKKGESILYAGKNKGTFSGIDSAPGADAASSSAWSTCFGHDCWKMGKDDGMGMGSDPSSSIPAAASEEDRGGMIEGEDATPGNGPTDEGPDQPTGFDGAMGLDVLKKGMLR